LIDRGIDTLIGCAVALIVYLVASGYQEIARLPSAITRTLDAATDVTACLLRGDATSVDARAARRELQLRTIAMLESHDAGTVGSAEQRRVAERLWPLVVSVEYLAYQVLSGSWELQHDPAASNHARYTHWSDRAGELRGRVAG
jgi:hypothetical protein